MKDYEILNTEVKTKIGASKIHGVGIIAIKNIKKGERLFVCSQSFVSLTDSDIKKLKKSIRNIILDRHFFSKQSCYHSNIRHPNSGINLQCFMNHSETPNSNGQRAFKKILKGEEITENFVDLCGMDMSDLTREHIKCFVNFKR